MKVRRSLELIQGGLLSPSSPPNLLFVLARAHVVMLSAHTYPNWPH